MDGSPMLSLAAQTRSFGSKFPVQSSEPLPRSWRTKPQASPEASASSFSNTSPVWRRAPRAREVPSNDLCSEICQAAIRDYGKHAAHPRESLCCDDSLQLKVPSEFTLKRLAATQDSHSKALVKLTEQRRHQQSNKNWSFVYRRM